MEQPLKRSEIKRILGRHDGSKAEVARRAGVKQNTVSMWLAGAPSANVAEQAEKHARELLAKEEARPSVRAVLPQLRNSSTEGA